MTNRIGAYRAYSKEFPEQLCKMMEQGFLDCEIIKKFHISPKTFYKWINENPEFKEAYETGIALKKAWWIESARKAMLGKIKGFNDRIWTKFIEVVHEDFKKQPETTSLGTTVNINNMQVIQQKSNQDLVTYIKDLAEKNKNILAVDIKETQLIEQEILDDGIGSSA